MARSKPAARSRTNSAVASPRRSSTAARARPSAETRAISEQTAGWIALGVVLSIAAFMAFFRVNRTNYALPYYAAGVRSMLTSFHNAAFVSLDPAGFVTIDKPPLGFWIQALFAKALGFGPVSVSLPQALAGIASVGVVFHLVRRSFGLPAGFLAGLALALMPVSVVANRTNLLDPLLVLSTLLAAWAFLLATEADDGRRRLGWLLLGAVAVGVGFNIKSAQVLLPTPALFLLYLLAARERWTRKIGGCALACAVIGVLAFAWPLTVDSIPEDQRPYVGSTSTNREMDLILGYNSVQRLTSDKQNVLAGRQRAAGPLWYFNRNLGGQINWLLPVATLGGVAAWRGRPRPAEDRRQANLILWGTWVAIQLVFFSIAQWVHPYYLVMMAPALAALIGIGAVALWTDFRAGGWRGWLLPAAVALTLLAQLRMLNRFPDWRENLAPAIVALCAPAAIVLAYLRLRHRTTSDLAGIAAGASIVGLLIAPAVWAGIPVWNRVATNFPTAGPTTFLTADEDPLPLRDPAAHAFLLAHHENERFVVATRYADDTADLIVATGAPAMALGGFDGDDPILSVDEFIASIAAGDVRYVLIDALHDLPDEQDPLATTTDTIRSLDWVSKHCSIVPWAEWRSMPAPAVRDSNDSYRDLYDCADAGA